MQTIEGGSMETMAQYRTGVSAPTESPVSAVTWPAIFGGAFVATATTIVLVALGSGLGLAAVSPWRDSGPSASGVAWMAAAWLIVVQWFSSGVGGYLAGRLRTKWANTHTHEVFFRDTAHGFVTWAVATIVVVGFLASAAGSGISGSVHAAATVGAGAAAGSASGLGSVLGAYDTDRLFRSSHTASQASAASTTEARAEATRILANGVATGDVPTTDRTYLAELVAARTGISADEAQKRVDDAIAQAKSADLKARQVADAARKSAAATSIFTALSMLVGAFIACVAAALGGQRRDLHV